MEIMFKSSVISFRFNLNLQLFDLLMGEPQDLHFYDFGVFGRVPEAQNQLGLSSETPGSNPWNLLKICVM